MFSGLRLRIKRENSSEVNGSRSTSLRAFRRKRASIHNIKLRTGRLLFVLFETATGVECSR